MRILLSLTVLLLSATNPSYGATLRIAQIGQPDPSGGVAVMYMITNASVSPGELKNQHRPNGVHSSHIYLYTGSGQGSRRTDCFMHIQGDAACEGDGGTATVPNASPITSCATAELAAAQISKWVGMTWWTYRGIPTSWLFGCGTGTALWVTNVTPVQPDVPAATCTSNTALLTLRGKVGERLRETIDLQIQCDAPASVRMSMTNGGVVPVGGGGEVLLKFQANGSDILNVSGTDLLVPISGELTASPTTAGSYRGSTVLRLDIL